MLNELMRMFLSDTHWSVEKTAAIAIAMWSNVEQVSYSRTHHIYTANDYIVDLCIKKPTSYPSDQYAPKDRYMTQNCDMEKQGHTPCRNACSNKSSQMTIKIDGVNTTAAQMGYTVRTVIGDDNEL